MARNTGGIEIFAGGRPGAVPTHVVTPHAAAAPGTTYALPGLTRNMGPTVATVDPFAFIGRARKALGRKLTG
jgi:hypothetical protein